MSNVEGVPALAGDVASYQTNIADPTDRLHGAFSAAYHFFNGALFEERLPRCMITLRARNRSAGYFAHERFQKDRDTRL